MKMGMGGEWIGTHLFDNLLMPMSELWMIKGGHYRRKQFTFGFTQDLDGI